jgi:hypothetical protein
MTYKPFLAALKSANSEVQSLQIQEVIF